MKVKKLIKNTYIRLFKSSKTKYKIVSLGSGCDIKLFLINPLLPHYDTEFFDWLWNFDGGLFTVKKIIEDEFSGFNNVGEFYSGIHPKFESKLKSEIKSNQVSLKFDDKDTYYNIPHKYPEIVFMHYENIPDIVSFNPKRIDSFRRLIKKNNTFFVYYRQFDEPINSEYINNIDYDLSEKLNYWQKESLDFIEFINKTNPNLKLLSLFAMPYDFNKGDAYKLINSTKIPKNLYFDFLFYKGIPENDQIIPAKKQMKKIFNKYLK